MRKWTLGLLFLLPSAFILLPSARADDEPTLNDAEKKFTERMTNVVMVGQAVTNDGAPKPDRYTIVSVKKIKGDDWTFTSKIKFGENEMVIPITIPVKWAGDTPVITVSNWGLPGIGTFNARVVIDGDKYAGTWEAVGGKPHGGYLWGKIEKAPAADKPAEKAVEKPAAK
jgi:hypothetical protein